MYCIPSTSSKAKVAAWFIAQSKASTMPRGFIDVSLPERWEGLMVDGGWIS